MRKGTKYLLFLVFATVCVLFITVNRPARANDFFDPHGNYDTNTAGCAVCHNAHFSRGQRLLPESIVKSLCYSCHDGSKSNYDVKAEFGELDGDGSSHPSYHPVPDGEMTCTDCHSPHLTPGGDPDDPGIPGILSVGESGVSSGNAVCGVCHYEGSLLPGSDIVTSISGTPHDLMLGPSSGTDIKCIRCHQPHGSPYESLLQERIHDDNLFFRSVTGNNNTVCFGCHTSGVRNYLGETIFSQSLHGSPPEPPDPFDIKATSVYPGTSYLPGMCANCHEPHGRTGNTNYTRAEGNNLCVSCHDDDSVTLPDNYSYRGILAYDITPHSEAEGPPGETSLYRAFSQDFTLWEWVNGQTPDTPGQLVDLERITHLHEWDSSYVTTDLAVEQGDYNTHMYKFKLTEPLESITRLKVKWIGYGEPTSGHPVEFSLWNFAENDGLGGWENITAQNMGTEGVVEIAIPDEADVADYLNAEMEFYLLVGAMHDATPPEILNFYESYIAPIPPSTFSTIRVSWNTNESAKTWIEYGSTEFSTTLSDDTFKTMHSFDLTGLENDIEYFYQFNAEDALGNLVVSEIRPFVLSDPPPAAVIIPRTNLWTVDPPINTTLSWYTVDDPDRAKIQYKVEISNSIGFSTIIDSSDWLNDNMSNTMSWTTSLDLNQYYWRVKTRYSDYPIVQTSSEIDNFYINYSCPVLYTWNGEKFVFVTDIAAGSNLGLEIAPGRYLDPPPNEQVVIPGSMLAEKDGYYTIKIKNELDEIDFIDNLQLQAVDHPIGTNIALNDFMRHEEPFTVYTYSENVRPVEKATYINNPTYSGGEPSGPVDITELVSKIDNRHAVGTLGNDNQFIFDLGNVKDAEEIKLVVVGWTEFMNEDERAERVEKSRQGVKTADNLVEVLQPDGSWRSKTIKQIPGHTKTAVIDLTGMFIENTEEYIVRLRGLYRPHLDFVGVDTTSQAPIKATELALAEATLEYGGIADRALYPSPFYDYYNLLDFTLQHEGRFTRYGNVLPLVQEIDDRLVVMDTGDELTVRFQALSPPGPGMTRSFVLKPWAYYKELSAATVEPMPFRGMDLSKYPESLGEYPEELKEYIEEWNTRVHPTTSAQEEVQSEELPDTSFFTKFISWLRELWYRLLPSGSTQVVGKAGLSNAAEGTGQPLHYSLNANYLELEVESTLAAGGIGYCSNCHAAHGNNNGTKQLKNPVTVTCFGNGFGCHSDPQNSASGSMSAANFFSETGPISRHIGPSVDCLSCHNPHINNAENKTVDPFNTNVFLNQWVDNGIGNYIGADGSVYLLAMAKHDGTPPIISNIYITPGDDSATVSWTTDKLSTGQLSWIITAAGYEDSVPNAVYNQVYTVDSAEFKLSQSLTITDMVYDKDYHYLIMAKDQLGNEGYSSDPYFSKLIYSPRPPQTIQKGKTASPGDDMFPVELQWYKVVDHNDIQYQVQISVGDSNFSTTYVESPWLNETEANIQSWTVSLPVENYIYWRVKSRYTEYPFLESVSVTRSFELHYSCPVLYTWNGEKYTFVTDIVGGIFGHRGSSGRYINPSPGDQLVIPGDMLIEKDGFYRLKIKNELDEIDYIDNLVLQVVDHPLGTKIALNDFVRRTEPYEIYTFSEDVRPVKKATYFNNPIYSGGDPTEPVDITELVSKIDNRHAIGKLRDDNHFIFDLGDVEGADNIKLIVVGWNEFANIQEREEGWEKAKEGISAAAPILLEVLQPDGTWTSENISAIPGHTKTMVIDLTGKFAEDTEEYIVRLRGLYRPHLDFVGVDTSPQALIQTTDLDLLEAILEYGGVVDRTLYPSPYYDYYKPTDVRIQHEGKFTRYGDVLPLLQEINDKLVVMDTGDELSVAFKALPPPEPGMTRSYVLKPWVYYKETSAATVDPMPFRGMDMSQYPALEYPEELLEYIEEWNTRVHSLERPDSVESGGKTLLSRLIEFFKKIVQWLRATFGRSEATSPFTLALLQNSKDANVSSTEKVALPLHYSLNTESARVWLGTAEGNNYEDPDSVWDGYIESAQSLPTPGNPGFSLSPNAPWSTSLAGGDEFNYQLFKFTVQESVHSIQKMLTQWNGYGEPTVGYDTSVYIWNLTLNDGVGDWEELATGHYYQPTTVDFFVNKENTDYCNNCHDNNPPEGVIIGAANIADSVQFDFHGDKKGTKATLKAPYGRGSGRLACDDCHEPHGSSNVYHLRETVNFQGEISISENGQGVKALCESCHTGDFTNDWHSSCNDCHVAGWTDIYEEHSNLPLITEGMLSDCLSCHGHSRDFVFPPNTYCTGCHSGSPNSDVHNYFYDRAF